MAEGRAHPARRAGGPAPGRGLARARVVRLQGSGVHEPLRVEARDGFPLAADLFLPDAAPTAAVLIAPAMGVPRGYYAAFAGHLAREGLAALTLDYRGIGGSRAGALRGRRGASPGALTPGGPACFLGARCAPRTSR